MQYFLFQRIAHLYYYATTYYRKKKIKGLKINYIIEINTYETNVQYEKKFGILFFNKSLKCKWII